MEHGHKVEMSCTDVLDPKFCKNRQWAGLVFIDSNRAK